MLRSPVTEGNYAATADVLDDGTVEKSGSGQAVWETEFVRPAIWIDTENAVFGKAETPDEDAGKTEDDKTEDDKTDALVGQHVDFGTYEQDGDASNGAEAISWQVKAVEDGKALLISDKALAYMPYNNEQHDVTWETCSLRSWLNNDFCGQAFTEQEQKSLLLTTLQNAGNPDYGSRDGADTQDYVFLLSFDDIKQYYGLSSGTMKEANEALKVQASEAAWQTVQVRTEKGDNGEGNWWLRTLGDTGNLPCEAYVSSDGHVASGGSLVYSGEFVRPAIWVELSALEET